MIFSSYLNPPKQVQYTAMRYDVVVIGGGPSGLLAAARSASEGLHVLLLERMPRLGTKLRITGKGRCNITNIRDYTEYREVLYGDIELAMTALKGFPPNEIVNLLNREGVPTIVERGNRVYPLSGRASEVAEALTRYATRAGVTITPHCSVQKLVHDGDEWLIQTEQSTSFQSQAVILATGGKSYPRTGSDGTGYQLAQNLGHRITQLFPSLVGFYVNIDWGIRERLLIKNVGLTLYAKTELLAQLLPVDIEICDDYLGGPGILRLSRKGVEALLAGTQPVIAIDWKPALSPEKLTARIRRDLQDRGNEVISSLARAWLPSGLIKPVLRRAQISLRNKGSELGEQKIAQLVECLKHFPLNLLSAEDWDRAVVTAGGIDTSEINPLTLESRKHDSLYFCGEILDIDANTGGYNLQLAYATGFMAGGAAAQKIRSSSHQQEAQCE